ncbi:murein L,D-transpeptidase catalytic domain family protein [Sphingomonas solaris]|uniref:Murein L,D-transpeptidase catalytic domain family protein n=1 Tax=Alterirhizorhabdus solaris TaxID=2529389 RepID=A0A558RD43_9SPHN|nr:murein L,D-transpeptidase catalytic domain family protein [Sphingomonas solaris]TVV77253.1 murein L,D-transpeptidase catalytic domain family protein [Sphingomonas solaris]
MTERCPAGQSWVARRTLLAAGLGLALSTRAAGAVPQAGLAAIARDIRPDLVAAASAALARHESAIWSRDAIAIVDFALPSATPRLYLIDLLGGTVTTMLVAHGKGSDPDHSGMLAAFSNVEGSAATSRGAYLTGEAYDGIHGASRRLIGLDPSNDHAEARAIVIHSAWYVGPEIVARQGVLGRSDGCFAVSTADIGPLLARLGRGRLLYAG